MFTTLLTLVVVGVSPFAGNRKPLSGEEFLAKIVTFSTDPKVNGDHAAGFLEGIRRDMNYAADFFIVDPKTAFKPTGKVEKELKRDLEWLQRMAKPDLADQFAKAQWLAYKEATHPVEPIAAKAKWQDETVVWSFGEVVNAILVDTGKTASLDDESKASEFAIGFVSDHMNLSERPKESVRCYLRHYKELWAGMLVRGMTQASNGSWTTPMEWDCGFYVVTDGRYVMVRWVLREPQDATKIGGRQVASKEPKTKSRFGQ